MKKYFAPLLLLLSYIYIGVSWCYQKLHDWHLLPQASFDKPIINIGNLAMGGTGKTPHVIWLAQWLAQSNIDTAIVSRGHGRKTKSVIWLDQQSTAMQVGDEPMLFQQYLPNTPIIVARKRVEGIRLALAERPQTKVILLDDALQHWGVVASFPILLTTFDRPFFRDNVVPFGYLRAKKSDYKRAKIILVTKCPTTISLAQKQEYLTAIKPTTEQQVFFSYYQYQLPYALFDQQKKASWQQLRAAPLLVVTAIATTDYLQQHVQEQHPSTTFLSFGDHHFFTSSDLRRIQQQHPKSTILVTEKDATKLRPHQELIQELGLTIYCLPIQVQIAFGEESVLKKILLKAIL